MAAAGWLYLGEVFFAGKKYLFIFILQKRNIHTSYIR